MGCKHSENTPPAVAKLQGGILLSIILMALRPMGNPSGRQMPSYNDIVSWLMTPAGRRFPSPRGPKNLRGDCFSLSR